MADVTAWLEEQLRAAGLSEAEFRKAGHIESGTLSNAKSRNSVGPDLAKQIARGLGKPQAWVFYQLGIMDEDPEDVLSRLDAHAFKILEILEGKTDAQIRAAEANLVVWLEDVERSKRGQGHSENRQITGRQNKGRA